jgi:hypothetical protein
MVPPPAPPNPTMLVPAAPVEMFAPPAPAWTRRASSEALQDISDSDQKAQQTAHEALAAFAEDGMMSSFPARREPEKHAPRP